ncbi:MAG: histidine phosphatase family protein [Promethearchaeota archaeon]|nr:MAG: histidine phosphatase family protein [Candidatus Lokiarchaeota archaeon]
MSQNIEAVWQTAEWTKQARNIISGIKLFPKNAKIFLFLRHSQREDSNDATVLDKMELTELGFDIARIFGTKLPTSRHLLLFYSHSPRCVQTAQAIIEGFYENGGRYEVRGTQTPVNKLNSKKGFITTQALKYGGPDFITRWRENNLPRSNIIGFEEYCQKVYNYIKDFGESSREGTVCIHVTHDLFVMALREGWFNYSSEYYWPSFLGGFAISIGLDTNYLLDHRSRVPIPFVQRDGKTTPLFKIK